METKFRTYIGTKTVKAMPMGAAEALQYGAQITEETVRKNIGNQGYLVEYPDGYRSWSPSKQFDEVYRLSETAIDELKNEYEAIGHKIVKAFLKFHNCTLTRNQRDNIKVKLDAMMEYENAIYWEIVEAEAAIRKGGDQ